MDSKIFLRKYRVAAEEIAAVGEPGSGSRAYEGEEIESGKTVVVEILPAGSLKTSAREKLEAEAMAARKLTHANIPALHDFGVEDDLLVYVTEVCEGTLAEEWVNANGPMPVGPVLRIASQVVSALGAAAFHRIAHRAINPSNLVLVPGQTADGEWPLVKILHFVGIVPKFSEADAAAIAPDKALPYASPEQLRDGTVDFRSEIYSLGGTMWFLLTGTPPPMAAQMTTAWLAVDQMSVMPKKIGRLLAKMLSVDPAERPGDPLAFYRQLQDCLTDLTRRETTTRPAAVPAARTIAIDLPKKRRSPLKTLARAALVLALAALSALGWHEYFRHRRVVEAEEPIGVPIGVAEVSASATPVIATAPDTMVSIVRQPTPVAVNANTTQSTPATNAEPDNNAPPVPDPTRITANNLSTLPAAIDSSRVVSTSQAETAPAPSPSPKAEAIAENPPTEPKKTIMHEVRRAQPADEDEAPPEPSPPGEGPAATPVPTASPVPKSKSRKPKRPDPNPTILFKVPSPEH